MSLEHEQYRRVEADEAKRKGFSLLALIRNLVDKYFGSGKPPEWNPLEAVIGIGSGTGESVGREHNRYLYEDAD